MNVIHKDILTINKGIIAHQCNTKGVMSAGLAGGDWSEVSKLIEVNAIVCKL